MNEPILILQDLRENPTFAGNPVSTNSIDAQFSLSELLLNLRQSDFGPNVSIVV